MAIAKVILNGETLMDVTSDTVEASKLLSTYTATKNDGTKISGSYVPPSPVISSLTVTPTETAQMFNAAAVSGYKPVTVEAISSNYIGSAVPLKSAADLSMSYNNATDTADITSPYGYYSSQAIYKMSRALSNMSGPLFNSSTGLFSGAVNITTSGYISSKTISYSHQLTTLSAQTIYPSTTDQTITAYRWLTGTQTIKSVTTTNLTAANIVSGTIVKVGDTTNASRITQVTGTYSGIIPTGTSNITNNGTYDIGSYRSVSVNVAGEEYYGLYRALAERLIIYDSGSTRTGYSYTSTDVSNYFNSLSSIQSQQFAGALFSGTFNFNNLTNIPYHAFGSVYTNLTYPSPTCVFNFPKITSITNGAFFYNTCLTSISASLCTEISAYAFAGCGRLINVNLPNCREISTSAFYSCSSLATIDFSLCSSIGSYAFCSCSRLTNVSLSQCSVIYSSAFYNCSALTTISLPQCSVINAYAFASCTHLTSISLPQCVTISGSAFRSCSCLTSVNLPQCNSIASYAFYSCSCLTSISVPQCVAIGSYTFYNCFALTTISLPQCQSIYDNGFGRCYNLLSLYLMSSSVVALYSAWAFSSTPIYGYTTSTGGVYGSIYVPASLYNSYKTATNWTFFSSRFVSV